MSIKPADPALYQRVKRAADKKFASKSGVYKSSWIVMEYKRRGGKYIGEKPKSSGLKRWYREGWVDLNRPIRKGKKIVGYQPCGRSMPKKGDAYPLCRPSRRVTKSTPKTYKELSKSSIRKAKSEKRKVRSKGNIRFSSSRGGGEKSQYYGRKSSVMIPVPKNVKKWAEQAFVLRKIGFKGATETGWRRAKQLATRDAIPIQDLRYMRNWYARHIITSYPTFKEWKKMGKPKDTVWFNKRGIISWMTWGGNAGFRWINSQRVIDLLNRQYDKDYHKIRVKV